MSLSLPTREKFLITRATFLISEFMIYRWPAHGKLYKAGDPNMSKYSPCLWEAQTRRQLHK
jgi:hypothetical protein